MLPVLTTRVVPGRSGLLVVMLHALIALVAVSLALAPMCLEPEACGGTCEHDNATAPQPQVMKAASAALPATAPVAASLVALLPVAAEHAGMRPIPPGLETGRLLI